MHGRRYINKRIVTQMITTIPNQQASISTVDALWTLIQGQTASVRKALTKRILDEAKEEDIKKVMVKKSLTQAFKELNQGLAKHNARALFSE